MAWVFIAAVVTTLVVVGGMVYWADRTSATGVTKRLAKRDLPYRVKVGKDDEAWDPSKRNHWGDSYSLEGPGVATYTLDRDSRVVNVEWDVEGKDPLRRSGPVPDHCLPLLDQPKRHRLSAAASVALVYVLGSGAGLEIGYATARADVRDETALFGGVAGLVLAYVVMAVVFAIASSRHK